MNRHLAQALGATALGVLLLQPVTTMADPPAHARNENSAQHRGYSSGGERHYNERWDDRDERRGYRGDDRSWDHDRRDWDAHRHPQHRDYVVHHLPPRHRVAYHHGHPYYYAGGYWYRPYGPRYVVTDPPVGLVVSFLPQFGTTLYFGGVPHYRSGPVYYVWNPRARGYVVTDRPYRRW
jgi:hypothetical protein